MPGLPLRSRPWRTLIATVAAMAAWFVAATALASTRVVVLGTGGEAPPRGLVEALRVQLLRAAEVAEGPALPPGSLSDQVERAALALEASSATLVVWMHAGPRAGSPQRDHELLVMARHRERALLVVTRVPPGEPAETDRALALKIREVLDEVLAEQRRAPDLAPLIARASSRPAPASRDGPQVEQELGVAALAEVGCVLTTGAADGGLQPGASFGAGARVTRAALAAEIVASAAFLASLEAETAQGRASVREADLASGLRVHHRWSRVGLGGFAAAGVRLLDASGTSSSGGEGTTQRTTAHVVAGPDLRVVVAGPLEARAAVGLEIEAKRQRFTIQGEPVIDLGHVRGVAHMSLLVALP
jgi:hypothetical protein